MNPIIKLLFLLCTGLAWAAPAPAAGIDLHAYWDQRCFQCHGHAGEFARRSLRVDAGQLQGSHHRKDLERFLRQHYLNDALVAPVSAMLAAQVTTAPLYSQKCASCHGTAAEFTRASLTLRGGVLVGLPSGRRLSDTLAHHGKLTPAEQALVVDTLARVLGEVSGAGR
ncbi:MAG: hypothetical protein Q8N44_11775 [Rubrivivax sp.]|nr:hypothetical protein [Rubrivivax sp.]MDP3084351.1 hypothetical protein [Rubrivivax sp.]